MIIEASSETYPDSSSRRLHREPNQGGQSQTNHEALFGENEIRLVLHGRRIVLQTQLVQQALARPVEDPTIIFPIFLLNGPVVLWGLVTKPLPHESLPDSWNNNLPMSVSVCVTINSLPSNPS